MLTEQKPPCAAKFGVPNCLAHQPVNDWLWSRPVKNASLRGSVARMSPSHCVASDSASLPLDLLEVAAAALAGAQQRLAQPGRRVVVHDAGGALAADHATVHRVVRIAVDVADAAVLQVHTDAAAAGAHVAGGVLHLVGDGTGMCRPSPPDARSRVVREALSFGKSTPSRSARSNKHPRRRAIKRAARPAAAD